MRLSIDLTPQDLWALRNIAVRTINETYEVLSAAARRQRQERLAGDKRSPISAPRPAPEPRISPPPSPHHRVAYSIKDAAQALGISWSTLYKLIGSGRIPTIRVVGRRLIERNALEAFLAATRGEGGAPSAGGVGNG
jgi:excisionase family DNA binding protein